MIALHQLAFSITQIYHVPDPPFEVLFCFPCLYSLSTASSDNRSVTRTVSHYLINGMYNQEELLAHSSEHVMEWVRLGKATAIAIPQFFRRRLFPQFLLLEV